MILKTIRKTVPTEGDYKVETRFAFAPTVVKGKMIWMQKYQELYEWKEGRRIREY